jgi:arylsulfatase A-like enzyme
MERLHERTFWNASPVRPSRRFLRPGKRAAPQPVSQVLLASAWFGLATGPVEVGLILALKPLHDPTPGFFHMNRHVVWMIPVFHLAFFLLLGLAVMIRMRLARNFSPRRAAFFFALLSVWSLLLTVRQLHTAAGAFLAACLAARIAPVVERLHFRSRRFAGLTLPLLAGLFLALTGFSLGSAVWNELRAGLIVASPLRGRPNVLLLVLDTVRADHLSLYGYPRETTPNVEKFARRGVVFEQARSAAPWTLPSHASIFTGKWPHQLSAGFDGPLDASAPTLAELLRDQGYSTAGFVANTLYCGAESGLARGFHHFEDHEQSLAAILDSPAIGNRIFTPIVTEGRVVVDRVLGAPPRGTPAQLRAEGVPDRPYKDAARIRRDALEWIDGQHGQPFFAFLNFFDAHTPYLPPEHYQHHFGTVPRTDADYATLFEFWGCDKQKVTPSQVALARDVYDDCVSYIDQQLGILFDELERRGVLRDTVVIVTADHGEEFGEHGLFGHAASLYKAEVHVPLIVVAPSVLTKGLRVSTPVSLRNIAATVAGLTGLAKQSPLPGYSLERHWSAGPAGEPSPDELVLSEIEAPAVHNPNHGRSPVFRGAMSALVAAGKVYIRDGDGAEELYDLASDPEESHNLAGNESSQIALQRFREALNRNRREALAPRD